MNFASYAITSLAFGPGSAVLILGSLVSVAVIMISPDCVSPGIRRKSVVAEGGETAGLWTGADLPQPAEPCLIDAVKPGSQNCRAKFAGPTRTAGYAVMFEEVEVFHFRFHRPFPPFLSSKLIPR